MDLQFLQSCSDLDETYYAEFSTTREQAYALLDRIAVIAQPHDGAERTILFLARLALGNSWVDGGLRVDVRHAGMLKCQLKLMRDLGGDEFEVLKKIDLNASYLEFKQTAADPQDILPFTLDEKSFGPDKCLTFTAPEAMRRSTKPPPAFLEAQLCVLERQRWAQPPVPIIDSTAGSVPQLRPELKAALDKRRKPSAQRPASAGGYSIIANPAEGPSSARPLSRIATVKKKPVDEPRPVPSEKPRLGGSARTQTRAYGAEPPPSAPSPKPESEGIDDGWDED